MIWTTRNCIIVLIGGLAGFLATFFLLLPHLGESTRQIDIRVDQSFGLVDTCGPGHMLTQTNQNSYVLPSLATTTYVDKVICP